MNYLFFGGGKFLTALEGGGARYDYTYSISLQISLSKCLCMKELYVNMIRISEALGHNAQPSLMSDFKYTFITTGSMHLYITQRR